MLSAGPPSGAEEAFNAVSSAASEKERRVSEAEGRRSESLALARAEADRVRSEAESARHERVETARGARTRFAALAKEVAPARTAGLAHLQRETLRKVFSRARLVLLPKGGGAIRTFLPAVTAARPVGTGDAPAPPDSGARPEGPAAETGAPPSRLQAPPPASGAPGPAEKPSGPPPGLLPPIVPEDLLPRVLIPEDKVR